METIGNWIGAIMGAATAGLALWFAFRRIRRATRIVRASAPASERLPDGSLRIPMLAAFRGHRRLPWIAFASSSLIRDWILQPDAVDCGLIFRKLVPYSGISGVDVRTAPATVNVILEFPDTVFTYAANVGNVRAAASALRVFREKGCPLSERALTLLAKASSPEAPT